MPKSFVQNAEDRSIFLVPTDPDEEIVRKGERADTSPYRSARMIDINRIEPDPDQPRKTFIQESLESLADSIKELGGIIDPLTVEYIEHKDCFRILSGERRYRAAKIVGLDNLPCIVKDVDDKKRFLLQFVANLQREDIPSLEEAAGIKYLVEKYGYTQARVAKLLNKSKSYVSQIFGLERLSETAKEKVQTSELPKEVQIRASREKDPEKQMEILNKASEEGKTVRQIRQDQKASQLSKAKKALAIPDSNEERDKTIMINKFSKWSWQPDDGRFEITIRFNRVHSGNKKANLIRTSLEEVLTHLNEG